MVGEACGLELARARADGLDPREVRGDAGDVEGQIDGQRDVDARERGALRVGERRRRAAVLVSTTTSTRGSIAVSAATASVNPARSPYHAGG